MTEKMVQTKNPRVSPSSDYPPTRVERELFEYAWEKLRSREPIQEETLIAELVTLGVSRERAKDVIEAHFLWGRLPRLDEGGRPSVGWLIRKHSASMSTDELLARIRRYHPAITMPEIITELHVQVLRNRSEAKVMRNLLAAMALLNEEGIRSRLEGGIEIDGDWLGWTIR